MEESEKPVLYISEECNDDKWWEGLEVQKIYLSPEEFEKLLEIIGYSKEDVKEDNDAESL